MDENILNSMNFSVGWKKNISIFIFDSSFQVILKMHSFNKKDGITKAQEESYKYFQNNKTNILLNIQNILHSHYEMAEQQLTPTMLLIKRNGESCILFDDLKNPEEGIVVVFFPKFDIMSQNEYL